MSGWNGVVKCLSVGADKNLFTRGNIYLVVDGKVEFDNGLHCYTYKSFNDFCRHNNATWQLVDESTFTLSDLKDGMIVELNNGDFRLVCSGWLMGISSSHEVKEHNENLEYVYNCDEYHIKAVYTRKIHYLNGMFDKNNLTLIW